MRENTPYYSELFFHNDENGLLVFYFFSGCLPGIESFAKLYNLIPFFTKNRSSFLASFTATAIQSYRFALLQ